MQVRSYSNVSINYYNLHIASSDTFLDWHVASTSNFESDLPSLTHAQHLDARSCDQ